MSIAGISRSDHWRVHVVGVIACVLLSAVAYYVGIHPLVTAHAQYKADKTRLADLHRGVLQREISLSTVLQRLSEADEQLVEAPRTLMTANRLNQRLAEITALALNSGIRVYQVIPGEATDYGLYKTFQIKLAGTGSYRSYTTFLQQLHAQYLDIAVVSFDLISTPRDSSGDARFTIHLVWHAIHNAPGRGTSNPTDQATAEVDGP